MTLPILVPSLNEVPNMILAVTYKVPYGGQTRAKMQKTCLVTVKMRRKLLWSMAPNSQTKISDIPLIMTSYQICGSA